MKRVENTNHKKIASNREQDLALKKHQIRQVRLMKMNSKENIKKYWDERVDSIQEERRKDQQRIGRMVQKSNNSISALEEQERRIKQELLESSLMCSKLRTEQNSSGLIEDTEAVTWRNSRDQ